jgi:hypothetical protein
MLLAGMMPISRTLAHTNKVIQLRELMSDDPAFPNDKTWRNREVSEVESEFDLLQQEFDRRGGGGKGGGGGGGGSLLVTNAPEDLPVGDEIILGAWNCLRLGSATAAVLCLRFPLFPLRPVANCLFLPRCQPRLRR